MHKNETLRIVHTVTTANVKISKLHEQAPKARETLDQVRKNLDKDTKQ